MKRRSGRSTAPLRRLARGLFGALACVAAVTAPAQVRSGAELAADQGCQACHGTPPRKGAPGFAELAERYAPYRDDASAQQRLADKLRRPSIFGHVEAHERLSPEAAAQLVRWISQGAR